MPRAQGIWRTEWRHCDRCGFLTPITMLRKQLGRLICTIRCTDDLSIMYRPYNIAKVLAIPGEGQSEQPEKFKDPGELIRF